MKERIGKAKLPHSAHLAPKITVSKIAFFDKAKIANEFKKFFANIGIEPARGHSESTFAPKGGYPKSV